jgi:transposase-like protein
MIVIEALCVCGETSVSVRLNMAEQNNGQTPPALDPEAAQGFTAERVLRTRPRTYRAIVQLLADPHASVNQIAKLHRVSTHTVRAIRHREAQDIAERKKTLAAMLANVAELGASRMEETIGKAGLRDAAIGTGIAVDKMHTLTGQLPCVQIANVVLPTPEQDAERKAIHRQLDDITRLLSARDARKRVRTPAKGLNEAAREAVTDRRLIPIRD